MNHSLIISEIQHNKETFNGLLRNASLEEVLWKSSPEKWNLLEIFCHLYDEEREDFRARLKHVLTKPEQELPSINPQGWVTERKYAEKNFQTVFHSFLEEREQSCIWLNSLSDLGWKSLHVHPKFGPMSAEYFLSNWLAHDYLHMRQIIALKFQYLKFVSGEKLTYAGDW